MCFYELLCEISVLATVRPQNDNLHLETFPRVGKGIKPYLRKYDEQTNGQNIDGQPNALMNGRKEGGQRDGRKGGTDGRTDGCVQSYRVASARLKKEEPVSSHL